MLLGPAGEESVAAFSERGRWRVAREPAAGETQAGEDSAEQPAGTTIPDAPTVDEAPLPETAAAVADDTPSLAASETAPAPVRELDDEYARVRPLLAAAPRAFEPAHGGSTADLAITARGLGKLYRIGELRPGHRTIKEALTDRLLFRHGDGLPEDGTFWALRDVSFDVPRGQAVAVVGRNGSGKSTLLKILSRVTPPTEGRAEFRGRVAALLEIGTGFHPELSGRENVYLNASILGMSRIETKNRFDDIVAFSGVERFLDTPVKHYSSGMYVRLAFSVAAHIDPDILITDEVLAVGDNAFVEKCLQRMADSVARGRTVLLVTHNERTVRRLCTRALYLRRGQLIADGTVDEVFRAYGADLLEPSTHVV